MNTGPLSAQKNLPAQLSASLWRWTEVPDFFFVSLLQEAEFLHLVVILIWSGPTESNLFSSVNNTCVRKQERQSKKICSIAASF